MAPNWNLAGTYFETCNCEAACPCVFLSPPTAGECTALVAWHIDKGSFGDLSLDGLNAALAIHSPGHMLQVKWKVALYLDEKAAPDQRDALTQILSGRAGGHPEVVASLVGEVLGVKSAAMDYRAEGKRRSLGIPGVVQAEIEALAGQGGVDATIHDHPFTPVPGQPAVVAKSKQFHYRDYGLQWELSEKNGFYSAFSYQGP